MYTMYVCSYVSECVCIYVMYTCGRECWCVVHEDICMCCIGCVCMLCAHAHTCGHVPICLVGYVVLYMCVHTHIHTYKNTCVFLACVFICMCFCSMCMHSYGHACVCVADSCIWSELRPDLETGEDTSLLQTTQCLGWPPTMHRSL